MVITYYQLIVDDFSRKVWIYFLKSRSDASLKIKYHVQLVEREKYPLKVAFIRSDGAKELVLGETKRFFESESIQPEVTAPYTPQQDGLSERYMGIVESSAKCMMLRANMPDYDWPFAASHAVYLVNNVQTKGVNSDISPN